jgi:Glycosyl hydrolases family 15
MLAIAGYLPGDDPRMKATIDAIARRLTDKRGLVHRYRACDGLPGEEGAFLLCTFRLAQALADEVEAATATFERAVAAVNDVGPLAEEVDPARGEMIGNFPQAFSHIGLINAAWAITQARQLAPGRTSPYPPCSALVAVLFYRRRALMNRLPSLTAAEEPTKLASVTAAGHLTFQPGVVAPAARSR